MKIGSEILRILFRELSKFENHIFEIFLMQKSPKLFKNASFLKISLKTEFLMRIRDCAILKKSKLKAKDYNMPFFDPKL